MTESSVLAGLDEISAYAGLTKRETREAVTSGAIPGRMVAGRWTSTKAAVDGAVEMAGRGVNTNIIRVQDEEAPRVQGGA